MAGVSKKRIDETYEKMFSEAYRKVKSASAEILTRLKRLESRSYDLEYRHTRKVADPKAHAQRTQTQLDDLFDLLEQLTQEALLKIKQMEEGPRRDIDLSFVDEAFEAIQLAHLEASKPVFPTNDNARAAAVPPVVVLPAVNLAAPVQLLRETPFVIFVMGQMYLLHRYAAKCIVFEGIEVFIDEEGNAAVEINMPVFKRDMHLCLKKHQTVIFIPLHIDARVVEDGVLRVEGHLNMLIYRPFKKIVERYDPHGRPWDEFPGLKHVDSMMKDVFETRLVLGDYTPVYRPAYLLCPDIGRGLQTLQADGTEDERGYCMIWCLYMLEAILLNPILNTVDVVNACIRNLTPDSALHLIRAYWTFLSTARVPGLTIPVGAGLTNRNDVAFEKRELEKALTEGAKMYPRSLSPESSPPPIVPELDRVLMPNEVEKLGKFLVSQSTADINAICTYLNITRPQMFRYFVRNAATIREIQHLIADATKTEVAPRIESSD
jgi:hypothetical protein